MKKPHVIAPTAVYDLEAARIALALTKSTLGRELRLKRLKCAKRAGRYFILGEWLLDWLRDGVLRAESCGSETQVAGR